MGSKIVSILPFLESKKVNDIYEAVKSGSLKGVKEIYLLPFLSKDNIKDMFYDLVKKAGEETDDLDDELEEIMELPQHTQQCWQS